jgi:hypothetical protein
MGTCYQVRASQREENIWPINEITDSLTIENNGEITRIAPNKARAGMVTSAAGTDSSIDLNTTEKAKQATAGKNRNGAGAGPRSNGRARNTAVMRANGITDKDTRTKASSIGTGHFRARVLTRDAAASAAVSMKTSTSLMTKAVADTAQQAWEPDGDR